VAVLCNLADIEPGALARQVTDLYLAEPIARNLARYAGEYRSDELGATYTVRVRDGELLLARRNRPEVALQPAGRHAFRLGGMPVRFVVDGEAVAALEIDAGRARGIRLERRWRRPPGPGGPPPVRAP
jgi:hypothetical protein